MYSIYHRTGEKPGLVAAKPGGDFAKSDYLKKNHGYQAKKDPRLLPNRGWII